MRRCDLIDARTRLGLTQIEMARELGVPHMTYGSWERNSWCKYPRMLELAVAFMLRAKFRDRIEIRPAKESSDRQSTRDESTSDSWLDAFE